MPRVRKLGVPHKQLELEEELRERYGGSLTLIDVCNELGVSSPNTAREWVKGMNAIIVNKKKRFRAADVAERLYQSMVTA